MNVLAMHASPQKNRGTTALIHSPFPEAKTGELLVRDDSIPSSCIETISRPPDPQDDYTRMNRQVRGLVESRRNKAQGSGPGTPSREIRMSVTERGREFPRQQGHSISFRHFLSGLISLTMSDTPGMKDQDRINVTITSVKPDEP